MDFGWMNKVGLTIHVKQDKLDHSGVQGVVRRVEATGEDRTHDPLLLIAWAL